LLLDERNRMGLMNLEEQNRMGRIVIIFFGHATISGVGVISMPLKLVAWPNLSRH